MSKPEEKNCDESHVCSKNNTSSKDLSKLPRIRDRGRLDSVFRNGHDGPVVKDGNNENHEGREVKLPDESHKHES